MRTYKNGLTIYDEVLPMHMMKGRMCVWWEQTSGIEMVVEYKKVKKHIRFISYHKRYVKYSIVENDNMEFVSCINTFICHGGCLKNAFPELLNEIKWKYSVGDIVGNIKIIDRKVRDRKRRENDSYEYIAHEKMYKTECLKCGYINDWCREDSLSRKGCVCCSNKILVKGKNDLATTNPELFKIILNPDDLYKYQKGTHKWLNVKCPFCQKISNIYISNIAYEHFKCQYCKDGINQSEKYIMNILDQLNIEYIYQLSKKHFSWCEKYKYDFYLPQNNTILEINGLGHFKDTYCSNYKDIRANDKNKKILALKNGITKIIYVDTRIIKKEYLENSINNNIELKKILGSESINFNKAWDFSKKSFLEFSCKFWNEGLGTFEISKKLKISQPTVKQYLKRCDDMKLLTVSCTKEEVSKRNNKYRSSLCKEK